MILPNSLKNSVFLLLITLSINTAYAKIQEEINPQLVIGWYFPSINSRVSRTDFQIALEFWTDEFNKSLKFEHIETRIFDQIDKLQLAFNNGELSLIIVPPLLLVKYFDLDTLANGFVGEHYLGNTYGVALLSRKDKNIKSVKDFKNKRLVMPENDQLAETFLGSLVIPQFNQNYQQTFRSVLLAKKQNMIIHSLFFDQADVGVAFIDTFELMAELNPQIKDKIKIIEVFLTDSPNYSFFHYQYPDAHRKIVVAAILKLNHSIRVQEILNNFRMARIRECSVEALKPIIRLNKYYNQLISQISKP